jgi:hypothetical protein
MRWSRVSRGPTNVAPAATRRGGPRVWPADGITAVEDGPVPRRARALLAALGLSALLALPGRPAGAAMGDPLYPNLKPLPASHVVLQSYGGRYHLRFSTVSWNAGAGPLELRAGGLVSTADGLRQKVLQRVYLQGHGYTDHQAGFVVYHPEHDHFHFENYAAYQLLNAAPPHQPATPPGAKTTFCVMDTTRVTRLPGAPKRAAYTTCGSQVQGMTVGWGDEYDYLLPGQELDVTGVPNGDYLLRITVDPKNLLRETSDLDNVSDLRIRLAGGTVTVLNG